MRYILLFLLIFSQSALSDSIFSLHVGDKWIYQIEGGSTNSATNSVAEVRTINGKNWYKLIEFGDSFWVRNTDLGQVEAVNFFDRTPDQFDVADEVLVFKYPAKVGETWPNNDSPVTYRGVKTITVPAGTFDCHEYYIDLGGDYYSLYCIAINIGIIYNEAVLYNRTKEISKLVRYEQ